LKNSILNGTKVSYEKKGAPGYPEVPFYGIREPCFYAWILSDRYTDKNRFGKYPDGEKISIETNA